MTDSPKELQPLLDEPIWKLFGFVTDLYKKDPEDEFFLVFSKDEEEFKLTINVTHYNENEGGIVH